MQLYKRLGSFSERKIRFSFVRAMLNARSSAPIEFANLRTSRENMDVCTFEGKTEVGSIEMYKVNRHAFEDDDDTRKW